MIGSLRPRYAPVEMELEIDCTLRGVLAEKLVAEARKRNLPPVTLLQTIMETILCDDLVDAILDEDIE